MKKTLLVIAALGLTFSGIAQDKYVTSALTALNSNHLDEAKSDIDKAMSSPETKEKPKALLAKGKIYLSLYKANMNDKDKSTMYYREGTQALIKLVEVKADYEKDDVNPMLFFGAVMYFNDGINAFNDNKYTESEDYMKNVVKIHNLGGGKRFEKMPMNMGKNFDTVAVSAQVQIARCAYKREKYDEVIADINAVRSNPIARNKDLYTVLLESYEKYNTANGNKLGADEMAAIAEARAAFPNDPNFKNMEMNTMMRLGKMAELQKKMEDDVAKDANNADLNYNLGILYQTLANPKDGKKPANAAELLGKAETSFTRAVKLAPDNGGYNNSLGTLYYQQGYDINEQMNAITGTSAADTKKYDGLKAQRDAFFVKATAPYEKATSIYGARPKVEGNDLEVYHSTLTGLRQIYIVLGKDDKAKEVTAKLKTLDGN